MLSEEEEALLGSEHSSYPFHSSPSKLLGLLLMEGHSLHCSDPSLLQRKGAGLRELEGEEPALLIGWGFWKEAEASTCYFQWKKRRVERIEEPFLKSSGRTQFHHSFH